MNKGFTLIELLAVVVIIAVVSGIGVVTFSELTKTSEDDYYNNLASNLEMTASSYFADNRSKRPSIEEVCSKVSLNELISTKYINSALDADGNSCDLENSYVYIKRNSDKQYEYKSALVCGDYTYSFNEEEYCVNTNENDTTILVSARTADGNNYLITRSYNNTDWVKVDVTVAFDSSLAVSKYVITNTNTNEVYNCDAVSNKCSYTFSKKGIYNVTSYNGSESISSRTFNIRIDKTAPTFTLAKTGNFNISSGTTYDYENSLSNVVDESGIMRINYILTKGGNEIVNETVSGSNISIKDLSSGNYVIKVKAYDKVLNESIVQTKEFYISRSIQLIDPLNSDYKGTHEVIDGKNYSSLGNSLPVLTKEGYEFLGWYATSTGNIKIDNNSMVESTSVALYARWS